MAAVSKKLATRRLFLTSWKLAPLRQKLHPHLLNLVPLRCFTSRNLNRSSLRHLSPDICHNNSVAGTTTFFDRPGQPSLKFRLVSTTSGTNQNPTAPSPSRQVWVSKSKNIFTNLALEDWLYRNRPFSGDEGLLLLWRNAPCVVIGRHQNPWAECDVPGCLADGVHVARRNSGGGAVYHDLGNVCVSFFTSRNAYNRKANLQLVVEAVTKTWPLDLVVNGRDDIVLDQKFKISGTAAKLGGKTAYHHCTLLTDVNKAKLQQYLTTKVIGLESRATESVRSEVRNLSEAEPRVDWEGLVGALSRSYMGHTEKEGLLEYVDPESEESFPGLSDLRDELRGWQWTYSRTPKFTIRRTFLDLSDKSPRNLDICLEIDKGRLSDINLEGIVVQNVGALRNMIILNLQDQVFSREVIENVFESTYGNIMDVDSAKVYLWIWQCFKSIFS